MSTDEARFLEAAAQIDYLHKGVAILSERSNKAAQKIDQLEPLLSRVAVLEEIVCDLTEKIETLQRIQMENLL